MTTDGSIEALGYVRLSEDRTGLEAGVQRQTEDVERRCRERGWRLIGVEQDNDTSAASGRKRPGFESMLARLQRGEATVVVAWALDRLQRNRRDELRFYELCAERKIVVSLCRGPDLEWETPTGRYLADNLGSLARMEVEIKSDRQKRAIQQAVMQGRRVGGRRPFGYEADGMTIRTDEATGLVQAYSEVLHGVPLAAIARRLNESSLFTPNDNPWTAQTIRPTLLNPRYCGIRAVGRGYGSTKLWEEVTTAAWPPLIAEEVFRAAQAILLAPGRTGRAQEGRRLLTGIAVCGVCGSTVHAGGRANSSLPNYRCRGTPGHLATKAEPIEDFINQVMIERLSRPDAPNLLIDERPDVAALQVRATALRVRRDEIAAMLSDPSIPISATREASARVTADLAKVERELAATASAPAVGELLAADDVEAAWRSISVDWQRVVIEHLIERITLIPPGRGKRTFDPNNVGIEWKERKRSATE